MLVTRNNFDAFLSSIQASPKQLAVDFETTGIWWWKSPHVSWYQPRIFSIQFSTLDDKDFYLDFEHSEDRLGDAHFEILARELFADPEIYWFDHNAKFELHHARNHGIEFAGTVHCTKHIARVVNNLEESLKLDDLGAKYLGTPKVDVKTYINENQLFTKVKKWGVSDKVEEWLHFDKLPLKMLVKYGIGDTRLCRDLGLLQLEKISEYDALLFTGSTARLSHVLKNENELTKTSFEMERVGIQMDIPYCEEAYANEVAEYQAVLRELPGFDPLSSDQIKTYFESIGEKSYKTTKKGNQSFDKDALEQMKHPVAQLILKYRYHHKRAHTYFENYIWLADERGVLHCDIQNSGADTGRQSIWAPSMQNVPKRRDKDETNYKVRRCFIPRPGTLFADFDYKGAEFYMAMDYSREMPMIEKIRAGEDPHAFTKERFAEAGFQIKDRDAAKTMTFRLIYGGGAETVGKALGFEAGWEAKKNGKAAKDMYFRLFPKFGDFLFNVRDAATRRGYVFNWLGRVLRYNNSGNFGVDTCFKSPNGIIQGGIGDTLKVAMNRIGHLLTGRKSKMLLPVHDAILVELDPSELELIPEIQSIMAAAYPCKILPLEVEAGFSNTSWADLTDEIPPVA
jgi:DNA polymerase I-like protein with 3'-5' exonuclease and polymerase domains